MFEVVYYVPDREDLFYVYKKVATEHCAWHEYGECCRRYAGRFVVEVRKDGKKFSAKDGEIYKGSR